MDHKDRRDKLVLTDQTASRVFRDLLDRRVRRDNLGPLDHREYKDSQDRKVCNVILVYLVSVLYSIGTARL